MSFKLLQSLLEQPAAPAPAPVEEVVVENLTPQEVEIIDIEVGNVTTVGEELQTDVRLRCVFHSGNEFEFYAEAVLKANLSGEEDDYGRHFIGHDAVTLGDVYIPQMEENMDLFRQPPEVLQRVRHSVAQMAAAMTPAEIDRFVSMEDILAEVERQSQARNDP